jgi:hypothetical protein
VLAFSGELDIAYLFLYDVEARHAGDRARRLVVEYIVSLDQRAT